MTTKKTSKKTTKKTAAKTKAAKKVTKKTTAKPASKQTQSKQTKQAAIKKATKTTAKKAGTATTKKITKTTAKTASKKTSKGTTTPTKRVLVCAEGDQCFWVNDGQVVKDLLELRDAMKTMEEKVFTHHVTTDRNDFATWVEDVLCDAECAAALAESQSKRGSQAIITRHLKLYQL